MRKRVVVYLEKEDHLKLRSKLALLGLSFSEWLRKKIKEFLNN